MSKYRFRTGSLICVVDGKSALIWFMVWCLVCAKPFSRSIMTQIVVGLFWYCTFYCISYAGLQRKKWTLVCKEKYPLIKVYMLVTKRKILIKREMAFTISFSITSLTLRVLKPGHYGKTRSISWLASPGHQQPWYWPLVYGINVSLSVTEGRISTTSVISISLIDMKHWNGNIVILTKFSSPAALEVVKMITSVAANNENVIKITTFLF